MMQDTSQKPETRLSAKGFRKKMEQLETSLLALIWNDVLEMENKFSNNLQKEDLLGATKELKTLDIFLLTKRDSFDDY